MTAQALVGLHGIGKSFGGVRALDGVDLDVLPGEVRALVGESGAGKSTLMQVLGGEVRPDAGEVEMAGVAVMLNRPTDAIRHGVSIIHQETALAPDLMVAENIFLGDLPAGIGWRHLNARAAALIARLGFDIPPLRLVDELPVAHQQVVEIAKALSRNSRVIVFDEPTAVLSTGDAKRLLDIVLGLRAEGVGIVYISHRLDEIYRITVLKDGRRVGTVSPREVPVDGLIRLMVGRPLSQLFGVRSDRRPGEVLLSVRDLSLPSGPRDVSFDLRRGEVVGLGGLMESGRTEVACALFGANRIAMGTIELRGVPFRPRSPGRAARAGVALVP